MDSSFYEFTLHINKLNKVFLAHIDLLLNDNGFKNVNSRQALLLSNIGMDATHVQDANSFGYYLGTNISYNVKDLVKKGYIDRLIDNEDKRCAYLVLTQKGKEIVDILESDNMSQQESLQKLKIDVNNVNEILTRLQRIF